MAEALVRTSWWERPGSDGNGLKHLQPTKTTYAALPASQNEVKNRVAIDRMLHEAV